MRQHISAYVSVRQHASAYVSIRQHTCDPQAYQYLYFGTSKASKLRTSTSKARKQTEHQRAKVPREHVERQREKKKLSTCAPW